jgi:hypothetical protein
VQIYSTSVRKRERVRETGQLEGWRGAAASTVPPDPHHKSPFQ